MMLGVDNTLSVTLPQNVTVFVQFVVNGEALCCIRRNIANSSSLKRPVFERFQIPMSPPAGVRGSWYGFQPSFRLPTEQNHRQGQYKIVMLAIPTSNTVETKAVYSEVQCRVPAPGQKRAPIE